jgi:hypothetical protein
MDLSPAIDCIDVQKHLTEEGGEGNLQLPAFFYRESSDFATTNDISRSNTTRRSRSTTNSSSSNNNEGSKKRSGKI